MIVFEYPRIIWLHVSRTGGTALYRALETQQVCGCQVFNATAAETHMGWREAARRWPNYRQIAVMRSPWEVVASCYGLFCDWQRLTDVPPQLATDWQVYGEIAGKPFVDAVGDICSLIAPPGGLSVHYCGPDTEVWQYTDRPYDRLSELLGVPIAMPRVNGGWPHPTYDVAGIDTVARHCYGDIARFGYVPPIPGDGASRPSAFANRGSLN